MTRFIFALLLVTCAVPARAQDGCDKFKWKLDKEHALLTSAAVTPVTNGDMVANPATALDLKLDPAASANLALAPERAPKSPDTFSGFVRLSDLPQQAIVLVTLSAEAWVDLVQNGTYVKSAAFSGVHDCPTMRKSVKFKLAPGPFAVQVSGVAVDHIRLTITPAIE